MNLRQAQRALADLMVKCQEAHVQLPIVRRPCLSLTVPKCASGERTFSEFDAQVSPMLSCGQDTFDGLYEASKALRHSRQNDKVLLYLANLLVCLQLDLNDALDELKQIFGVDPVWIQHQQDEEAKQRRRQKRGSKPKSPASIAPQPSGARSVSLASLSTFSPKASPESSRHDVTKSSNSDQQTGSNNEPQKQSMSTKHQPPKKEASKSQKQHQPPKSRIDRIIERNPAKNPKNEELAEEFVKLGGYELKHGDQRRGVSRMNVAKIIRNTGEPLHSGAQAKQLSGIGPSSAAKIDEVLHKGKMHKLEEYESAEENEYGDDEEETSREV